VSDGLWTGVIVAFSTPVSDGLSTGVIDACSTSVSDGLRTGVIVSYSTPVSDRLWRGVMLPIVLLRVDASCQTKVADLDHVLVVDEAVARCHVSVYDLAVSQIPASGRANKRAAEW
jgi:hypothetical protein